MVFLITLGRPPLASRGLSRRADHVNEFLRHAAPVPAGNAAKTEA
jgi:hypothetical protein